MLPCSFKGKTILITGGTGTFGNAFLRRALDEGAEKIIIFSRDEKKQFDMFHEFGDKRVRYIVGDVRDVSTIDRTMAGVDYVFHAAALKHVPACEYNVQEAVKTNILGTANVLDSSIRNGVKKAVVLSTDKAVYPCNAMGASKMLAEKIAVEKAREQKSTEICLTRFGNLVMSRGSAIPLFISQIKAGKPITLTDPEMTRFFMIVNDAIELVRLAFEEGRSGELFIHNAASCRLSDVVDALKVFFDAHRSPVIVRGARHGERMYEYLLTEEESHYATERDGYFIVDMSFDAERKPKGIPHFNSSSPERVFNSRQVRKEVEAWMALYGKPVYSCAS
jgi:UDP-glucose 4-epimerase